VYKVSLYEKYRLTYGLTTNGRTKRFYYIITRQWKWKFVRGTTPSGRPGMSTQLWKLEGRKSPLIVKNATCKINN